jgi:hypothetical protein
VTFSSRTLPSLPLVLWDTPPALEAILAQEGVAYRIVQNDHPLAFRAGRFVLFDSRRRTKLQLRSRLKPEHVAIDIQTRRAKRQPGGSSTRM